MPVRRLAVAAAALAAAATVTVPAPSAVAATATHVGIVVRFADGNVSTACASAGGNGYTVLSRKFQTHVGTSGPYAGFLLQINQLPNPATPDTTHYWSYWHPKSGGGWAYSSTGAGSYTPKAGGIEGWSYVNGQSTAPPPPNFTYAALCASSDVSSKPTAKPTATPTPKTSTPKSRTTSAVQPTKTATRTSPSSTASTAAPHSPTAARTTSTTARAAARTTHAATASPRAAVTSSARPALAAAAPSPTLTPAPSAAASTRQASSGFPAWGTIVALLVVLALGGGAWLATKRRPE